LEKNLYICANCAVCESASECLFIFSVSKLLLNAALYDSEIWHTAAWRPCPGLVGFCVYRGRRYQKWHF